MIIDIIVVLFLIFAGFAGYKKGLVGLLISLVGMVVSIILAFMLQGTIADTLYNDTGVGKTIEQSITKNLSENFDKKVDEKFGDTFYINILKNIKSEDEISIVSKQITQFILKGISFIGIFIIVFVICYVIRMMLNLVFDLPILSQLNKIGGIAIGILKALLKIWIVLAVIAFLAPLPVVNSVDEIVRNSVITNSLYNNNIFVNIIKSSLNM